MITKEMILNGKFDVIKFATMPKCTRSFFGEGGSGCLLTAFFYAMGLRAEFLPDEKFKEETGHALAVLNNIAMGLWPTRNYSCFFTRNSSWGASVLFCDGVMSQYDHGRPVEALNLLWEFIEATGLANKSEAPAVQEQLCGVV